MDGLMAYYHLRISIKHWEDAASVEVLKNTQICNVADAGLSVAMENLAVKALLYNVYPPDPTYGRGAHARTRTRTHTVILYFESYPCSFFYPHIVLNLYDKWINFKEYTVLTHWEMFLEHQISTLYWFLKNRVTMKTRVIAAENVALYHRDILHFNYIHKENSYLNL